MATKKKSVIVLFNQVEEDEYVRLREVDPASLDFTPCYDIHVATVQEEYDAIINALCAEGFRARGINLEDNLPMLYRLLTRNPPDVVFNLVEAFYGEARLEGPVAGLLELARVPYTGASPFSLTLCRRKGLTKQVLLQNGVTTPGFRLIESADLPPHHGLRYPLIVKPARQDASSGVEAESVVYDHAQLVRQLDSVFSRFKPPVLIEEFIAGQELHAAVLGNTPPEVLPIGEYDFSELPDEHPPLITYEVKWNPLALAYHKVHELCPARIDRKTEELVKEQALRAYRATFSRDYARIDIRLSDKGVPYILEVNPNPDLTEGVSFMNSAEKGGLSFSKSLRRIIELALERNGKKAG